jgi:quinoprotein glucose dehydrogenase
VRIKALGIPALALAILWAVPADAQNGATNGEWPSYGGDTGSSKYSPLEQIQAGNVERLRIAWTWDSPDGPVVERNRGITPGAFKATPIMSDGVLYIRTSLSQVAAIDAATGRQLWVFDPESWKAGRPTNLGFNSRGVARWADDQEARIFVATGDAHLWALDAGTGKPISGFGEAGKIDLTEGMRRSVPRRSYQMMSPPLVIRDVVIVGSSISDGPRFQTAPPGDVRAFDVRTGELKWIFHTIPQEGEFGNETWENASWTYTGNTNVWTIMSADEELGYVYLPVGTPTNDWYGGHRPGDNLFAESLVCLDVETGERVWHFQFVHHGVWDYDIPAAPTLLDLTVDGRPIKAVAQVTKQGFVYVFDRVTGEPVWPIEERPVAASQIPGEKLSPTQPFPTKPAPYERQGISTADLIDFTPELRAEAEKLLEAYEYGGLFHPPSEKGTINMPGWFGGANWQGAAADPETGHIYIPSTAGMIRVGLVRPNPDESDFRYMRGGGGNVRGPRGLPLIKPPYARITAIDLNSGEHVWMIPHGNGIRQRLIDMGIADPGPLGGGSSTGPVLTKTLLFIGHGGNRDAGEPPVLRAIDKATGEVIHAVELPAVPTGTPMTYMAGGRQYITLAFGAGATSGLMALALP